MISYNESSSKRLSSYANVSTGVSQEIREKIIKDSKPLLKGPEKCRKIWQALQVADYKKSGVLNNHALEVLFE